MLQGFGPNNTLEIFRKEQHFISLLKSHFPSLLTKNLYNEYVVLIFVLFLFDFFCFRIMISL